MELACHFWPSQNQEAARVVLLHGMGGTGKLWRPIAASLEDHFSVLAPDQRGHGGSRIPAHEPRAKAPLYTPLEYGKDLVETLRARNFHPAFVVGHSMGVRTAAALAYLKPEMVRGLVLVDLGFSGVAGGGLGEGLARFLRQIELSYPSRAALRDSLMSLCPDPAIAQYLIAVSELLPDGTFGFPFDRAALIETIHAARDCSTRAWIEKAATSGIPILVLRGNRSLVWSAKEFESERERFKNHPNAHFEEIEGAGHGLPFEKRPEFVERLKRFIESEG